MVENDENSITRNEQNIKKHIATHFKHAFQGKDNHENPELLFQKYNVNIGQISIETRNQLEKMPQMDEILAAIKNINNSEAPGYDAVTSKLIKHLAELIPDILSEAILKEMEGQDGRTLMTSLRKMILLEKRDTTKKTIKQVHSVSRLPRRYINSPPFLLFF